MAELYSINASEPAAALLHLSDDVFEKISLPLLLLSACGQIIDVNPVAEELFCRSRKRLKGCVLAEVLIRSAEIGPQIEKVATSGQMVLMRGQELVLADGKEFIADCWLRPLNTNGDMLLELHAEADRQLLTRAARQEIQAESLALLRRTLCHEVRNPLGGMRGAAQLLAADLATAEKDTELLACAELIIREVDRLNILVEQLGQEVLELQADSVGLPQTIENACQLLRLELSVVPEMLLDFDPSIPLLSGNADALQQLFLNLLVNAVQAGAAKITLATRIRHNHPCHGVRYATVVSITVIDDGFGVPGEIEADMFTPLVSGQTGQHKTGNNHGLGLAVAQQIAQQHTGELVYKRLPQGSRFELLLPIISHDSATAKND